MPDPALIQALDAATAAQLAATAEASATAFKSLIVQTVGTVIIGLGVPYITYLTARLKADVQRLEENTNHKMDELLQTTKVASHAEGVLEQKTKQEVGALKS